MASTESTESRAVPSRFTRLIKDAGGAVAAAPPWVPAVVLAWVLGVGVALYHLKAPHALNGFEAYDDGTYFGAAIRLTHGVLPYRDYVFVHPPGIAALLSPIALLGHIVGDRDAFIIARVVTAVVGGTNAALAAAVVRSRGAGAAAVAGVLVATFPLAVTVEHTVMLDGYLVFFCLLAALVAFAGVGEPASASRLFTAGAFLGVGGAVKAWAATVLIAFLVALLPAWRARLRPAAAGVIAGFTVISGLFIVLAPRRFFHDVITAQLTRGAGAVDQMPRLDRLIMLTGAGGFPGHDHARTAAVIVAVAVVGTAVAAFATAGRSITRLEVFLAVASATSVAAVLASSEFYRYYAYFPMVFVAMLFATSLGRLSSGVGRVTARRHGSGSHAARAAEAVLPAALANAALLLVLPPTLDFGRAYLSPAVDNAAAISQNVARGACVIFDEGSLAILANRYSSSSERCPNEVDPYGTWLAEAPKEPVDAAHPPRSLVLEWQTWFAESDYYVASVQQSSFVPWTPELLTWFSHHYTLVAATPRAFVYYRTGAAG